MSPTISFQVLSLVTFLAVLSGSFAQEQCLSDPEFNAFFAVDEPTCCQKDVCGLPCPASLAEPTKGTSLTSSPCVGYSDGVCEKAPCFNDALGFRIGMTISILISFITGIAMLFLIHGEAENFFLAGKSMPLWVVAFTLAGQSIDSNALLGNVTNSYKFHYFDGVVLPIGLGLSLILNGLFLAPYINSEENVLTLPDVLAKRYGKVPEILVSIATIVSFMMLLAGNLVGMGTILGYIYGFSMSAGIWTAGIIVWTYTVSGGLFSTSYTDVVQGILGWSGCAVLAYYLIGSEDVRAPPPSIGFPGYIYPDLQGDGGICDMYEGVACTNDPSLCCYNSELWCPTDDNCRADNGAYPFGDQKIFGNQMTDPMSLAPFPNSIFWNWCTIFILGFGNLAALDFQARCMAAKSPSIARWGCLIGGVVTFIIGVPFASLGPLTRVYYGPDSVHAEYIADTCSTLLGLPTCGMWNPDPQAFVKMMTHDVPPFLGGWCLVGIVAASMSTADGAILAMGTVFAHNIMRQFDGWFPHLVTPKNLVLVTRLVTIPLSLSSAFIATYYQSDNPAGATGYLLIVAFDVVLATVVVPLIGCFYAKNPRPSAAFLSIICGASTRMILEFVLPKDGYLVLPFDGPEYLNYGPAASTRLPTFIDGNATEVWNPDSEPCDQIRFEDYTGLDSLTSLFVSLIVYVSVQTIENATGKPLFTFSGLEGYNKENVGHKSVEETLEKSPDDTKASGETFVKEEADASVKDADEVADS